MWPASVLGPLLHGSSAMRHGSSNTAKEMGAELQNQGWVLCLQVIQAWPRGQRMTLFRSTVPLSVCVGGRSKEKENNGPALRHPVPRLPCLPCYIDLSPLPAPHAGMWVQISDPETLNIFPTTQTEPKGWENILRVPLLQLTTNGGATG